MPYKFKRKICFNYIHYNPVKAGLVKNPEDWEFSSFNELKGKEILINKNRITELGLSNIHPMT